MNKRTIGLIISLVASICGVLGWKFLFDELSGGKTTGELGMALLCIAFIGAFVSYILCGGFKIALSAALKLGKFGWIILPFPIDIITGIITMYVAMVAFVTIPIIFNLMAISKKNPDNGEISEN